MDAAQTTITLPISPMAAGTIALVVGVLILSGVIFGMTRTKDQTDWATLTQRKLGLTGLHPVLILFLTMVWGTLFLSLLYGLFYVIFSILSHATATTEAEGTALRWYLLTLTALTASLGAVISLPFTLIRVALNRRQTETAEQGHITDRINKAVEGLGAEKTDKNGKDDERTVPNLEVRIGAIYALERIAQDSDRDHVQIMEILCAYIRQNAPLSGAVDFQQNWINAFSDPQSVNNLPNYYSLLQWRRSLPPLREDLQTALSVFGRRTNWQRKIEDQAFGGKGYIADLSGTCLQKADLSSLNFSRVNFARCDLSGTECTMTDFSDSSFESAHLKASHLVGTVLDGCIFIDAELQGTSMSHSSGKDISFRSAGLQHAQVKRSEFPKADFSDARMSLSRFEGCNLQSSDFTHADCRNARLAGSTLTRSKLIGTDLRGTDLNRANLASVRLQGPNIDCNTVLERSEFSDACVMSTDFTNLQCVPCQLAETFGDDSNKRPSTYRPKYWVEFDLGYSVFLEEWRKWQADPDGYTPPPPPDDTTAG